MDVQRCIGAACEWLPGERSGADVRLGGVSPGRHLAQLESIPLILLRSLTTVGGEDGRTPSMNKGQAGTIPHSSEPFLRDRSKCVRCHFILCDRRPKTETTLHIET